MTTPKNIVICCDGTGNKFGTRNTNVVKLCEVLDRTRPDQVVYYDPGVGTMGDQSALTWVKKRFTRVLGGAIGYGLRQKVQEAYDFLAWHYKPGDRIYLFGFSRGAYTVRALAALLRMYGLVGPGCGNLSPYLMSMLCDDEDAAAGGSGRWRIANSFKKNFGTPVQIEFLGVFDTVSSVGWFWNPMRLPYTACNPSVSCVRHAVSIDEHRAFFQHNALRPANDQDFKEVWFAGVHSDVGGGYAQKEQGLAQVAFRWMVAEAIGRGLAIDPAKRDDILGDRKYIHPDPCAKAHNSLTWMWVPVEFIPQPRRMWYTEGGQRFWQWPVRINLFRHRKVPAEAVIHQSVLDRLKGRPDYRPGNLPNPPGHPVEP